jgi:hypothetical protein
MEISMVGSQDLTITATTERIIERKNNFKK